MGIPSLEGEGEGIINNLTRIKSSENVAVPQMKELSIHHTKLRMSTKDIIDNNLSTNI